MWLDQRHDGHRQGVPRLHHHSQNQEGQKDCRHADESEHHLPRQNAHVVHQQFPLILGWALMVHRVQGMMLDGAYVQLDLTFFASGQAFVT
ncbi:MAG: hypothetical protein AAFN68_14485, partial [Pseudomonadota bacterium]